MQSDWMIALSAMVIATCAAGLIVTRQGTAPVTTKPALYSIFLSVAGLSGLPLALAFNEQLLLFYVPALLPLLFLLPLAVRDYARRLVKTSEPQKKCSFSWALLLCSAGITLGYWTLPTEQKYILFLQGELPGGVFPAILAVLTFGFVLLWCVISIAYLGITMRLLQRYRGTLKDIYSNTERHDLRWFDGLIALLMALWASAILSLLSDNLGSSPLVPVPLIYGLAFLGLLTLIGYSLTTAPDIASIDIDTEPDQQVEARGKYLRSALSETQANRIAGKMEKALRDEALYADPNLSLGKLANRIGAPSNHVSQTLNEHLNTRFFDYVAHWRVEASKPLLSEGSHPIHDIALEVGFNARSTFYKAFKRETGLTPRAYRLSQTQENKSDTETKNPP